jgi:hypothetical protein
MTAIVRALGAWACALAGGTAAAAGLTLANYVAVGDTIVDMLDTSALAYSTVMLGLDDALDPPRAPVARLPAGPQTFSAPCPGGGSVSGRIADRDASGDLSVNDRFETQFNACRIDREVVTGRSEFVIVAHRLHNGVETTELAFRFHDLGSDTMRWNGPARAVLSTDAKSGGERYAVSYHDLAVARGAQPYRWNFTLTVQRPPLGDHTAQIAGSMAVDHAVLQLQQDELFVIAPSGRPRTGQITASDADGDRLQVEAGSYRYRYRFFARGNGGDVADSSSQSKPHRGP